MFPPLELSEESFSYLLSWLDLVCLSKLDVAIGNTDERLLWLRSLRTMDSKAFDAYEHSHSSLRWLIRRGARATRIRILGTELERDRITDQTLAGVGSLFTTNAHNRNFDNDGAGTFNSHSAVGDRLRNRDITIETNTCTLVRRWGYHQLTSIDLSCCRHISDIGVSALAEGCHSLTSINLRHCNRVSDIGVSALAEGCHQLTSIDLGYCNDISDDGLSALAAGCHSLTSIDLGYCNNISKACTSTLRKSYPLLTVRDY